MKAKWPFIDSDSDDENYSQVMTNHVLATTLPQKLTISSRVALLSLILVVGFAALFIYGGTFNFSQLKGILNLILQFVIILWPFHRATFIDCRQNEPIIQEECRESIVTSKQEIDDRFSLDVRIAEIRKMVLEINPDDCTSFLNDANIRRFLQVHESVKTCVDKLVSTVKWRNNGRYLNGCLICRTTQGFHVWRQIGYDKDRRPCFFFSLNQVNQDVRCRYTPFETLVHIIELLENGHATSEPEAPPGFTWILDLHGVSWADCMLFLRLMGDIPPDPCSPSEDSINETSISVLAAHYPMTLGGCIMLRPPSFVIPIWQAARSFLDPASARVYHFVRSPADIELALSALLSSETCEWIKREMMAVETASLSDSQSLRRVFRGPAFWQSNPGGHDSRGTDEYISRLCKPVAERASADKAHSPHRNIADAIDHGCI